MNDLKNFIKATVRESIVNESKKNPLLKNEIKTDGTFKPGDIVLFRDFLTADLKEDIAKYQCDKLFFVSNVPYYITTPILMKNSP